MTPFSTVKFLSGAALMDTNHGNTDGPGSLADAETEEAVGGVNISLLLGSLDNLDDGFKDAFLELAFLKFPEELGRAGG